MNLGKNIQHLRKQKKITQEQLAEMMSVSRQTIWEAEPYVFSLVFALMRRNKGNLSGRLHLKADCLYRCV